MLMIDSCNVQQELESCKTLREALNIAHRALRSALIASADVDALFLLAHACSLSVSDMRIQLIMGNDALYSQCIEGEPVFTRFSSSVARRLQHEPLQYILGKAPFRYLELQVGKGVFIPRPETEVVVQAGLDWLRSTHCHNPIVVDLCAGSGAIGLSVVTELSDARVWAVERSKEAMFWLERNYQQLDRMYPDLQIRNRYHPVLGDALCVSTLQDIVGDADAIISNPPYIPQRTPPSQIEVRDYDPPLALYGGCSDGLLIPQRVIACAYKLLRSGGLLVMEHDSSQADALLSYASRTGFVRARVDEDLAHRPRYLVACKP